MTNDAPVSTYNDSFYFKDVKITPTTTPQKGPEVGGRTDHMVEIHWDSVNGWSQSPEIKPFAPLSIDPTASGLHYAIQCFEGLKAYKSADGKSVRLFRPDLNLQRLNSSSRRIVLPEFNEEEFLKILAKFVEIEARFIQPGGFIYLRPYHIGTNGGLGIRSPTSSILGVVSTIMPNFSAKIMSLYASPPNALRAWPGGFGSSKLGANYGPTLEQNDIANKLGYDQVLWLFGENRVVTEAGGSNFVVVWKVPGDENKTEIVTCTLQNGTILPGITRRSAFEYLNEKYANDENTIVSEREFTFDDLEAAVKEGRLVRPLAWVLRTLSPLVVPLDRPRVLISRFPCLLRAALVPWLRTSELTWATSCTPTLASLTTLGDMMLFKLQVLLLLLRLFDHSTHIRYFLPSLPLLIYSI